MSSDDDCDFLSSSNDGSDDDYTLQRPSGRRRCGHKRCQASSSTAMNRKNGNIFTDMMEYVTFAHHDFNTGTKENSKVSGKSTAKVHDLEAGRDSPSHTDLSTADSAAVSSSPPPEYDTIVRTSSAEATDHAGDCARGALCCQCRHNRDTRSQERAEQKQQETMYGLVVLALLVGGTVLTMVTMSAASKSSPRQR